MKHLAKENIGSEERVFKLRRSSVTTSVPSARIVDMVDYWHKQGFLPEVDKSPNPAAAKHKIAMRFEYPHIL